MNDVKLLERDLMTGDKGDWGPSAALLGEFALLLGVRGSLQQAPFSLFLLGVSN